MAGARWMVPRACGAKPSAAVREDAIKFAARVAARCTRTAVWWMCACVHRGGHIVLDHHGSRPLRGSTQKSVLTFPVGGSWNVCWSSERSERFRAMILPLSNEGHSRHYSTPEGSDNSWSSAAQRDNTLPLRRVARSNRCVCGAGAFSSWVFFCTERASTPGNPPSCLPAIPPGPALQPSRRIAPYGVGVSPVVSSPRAPSRVIRPALRVRYSTPFASETFTEVSPQPPSPC
jgi:hypothetical protein